MNPLQYQLANVPMLGKGSILLDRLDANGNSTGLYHIGNASKMTIEPKDDIAEQYSSMNAASSLIATALKKRDVKLTITGTDFKSDVMALAMMSAGKSVLATTASTFTAEVLASATATQKGRYFMTKHKNVDNSGTPPVLTNNSATLTAGTDYVVVDPVQGLIFIPPGSTIVEGDPTTITYHTLVGSFDQVSGASVARIQARVVFSPDPTDGQKIGLEVHKVNFSPSGSMDMIGDDYGNWSHDGLVIDDTVNNPTSPLYLATFYP